MRKHGQYSVRRFGQIVLSEVTEAWNYETVTEYAQLFREVVLEAAFEEPWAMLVEARRWRLATPEVGPALAELSRWRETHGLTAAAYINDQSDIKRAFAEVEIGRGYLRSEMVIVDTVDEALAWLEQLGFEIPLRLRQQF